MNKNLNAIEYEIRNFGCNTIQHSLDVIHRCAERMAAEIERLKKHEKELNVKLSLYNTAYWEHPSGDMTGTKQLQEMNAEIARLKAELEDKNQQISDMKGCLHDYEEKMAELEKRPEVVFCKNCKKRDICSQIMRFPLLKQTIKKIPVNYCSLGQRRESEEGK